MKRSKIPPLGPKPRFIHDEERIIELTGAMFRMMKSFHRIPVEIVEEYNELTDRLETEQ